MLALAFLAGMRVTLNEATPRKKGQRGLDLWSISAQVRSAVSSAACNSQLASRSSISSPGRFGVGSIRL
jgi:hypothetical protein